MYIIVVMKRDFRESPKYALLLMFLKIYQWKCTILCIPFSSSCHGTFLMACFLWHRTSPGTRWTNLSVVTTGLPIHFPVLMVSAFTPAPDLYIISLLLLLFHVFPKTLSVPSLPPPIYSSFLLFLLLCFSPFSLSFPLLIPSSSVCLSLSVSHTHGHNTHTHTHLVSVQSVLGAFPHALGTQWLTKQACSSIMELVFSVIDAVLFLRLCGLQSSHSYTQLGWWRAWILVSGRPEFRFCLVSFNLCDLGQVTSALPESQFAFL